MNSNLKSVQDWDWKEVTDWVSDLNDDANKFVRCLGRYEINGAQLCAMNDQQLQWLYNVNHKTPQYRRFFFCFAFFVFVKPGNKNICSLWVYNKRWKKTIKSS